MNAQQEMGVAAYNYNTLPAGEYAPYESFLNMVGCPTNGQWNIIITDNWGIDNGYLFNWSISFDTVIYNAGNSSVIGDWLGNNVVNQNSDSTIAIPTTIGLYPYTYTIENELGCVSDTTIYIFVTNTIGVEKLTKNNYIKLYPNPVNNHITIESTENINTIEILSVTGNIIKQLTIEQLNNLTIDITTLKKGIYFIKINDNKTIKFVKN